MATMDMDTRARGINDQDALIRVLAFRATLIYNAFLVWWF